MTLNEIRKILDNTKVYVNGKSREIQEKLFSFGYRWSVTHSTEVGHEKKPFLFIYKDRDITYANDMCDFTTRQHREITADEILSLEITEPSYRPFVTKEECWGEMLKHHPFGWIYDKADNSYKPLRSNISEYTDFEDYFNRCNFADDTPFGIKED